MTTKEEMNSNRKTAELEDVKINVKIKLSALWVAVMFLYVYADIRGLYETGSIEGLIAGELGGFKINQVFLLVSALIMAIPSVMVFLSLALKPKANRWANIIVAIFFVVLNLIGLGTYPWGYDKFLIIVGLVFNALIVWYAWKWVA
jgi:hypothetical protein